MTFDGNLTNLNVNGIAFVDERKGKKPDFRKDDSAFESGDGFCYEIDGVGKWTRGDLVELTGTEAGAKALYEELSGKTPEKTADDDRFRFVRCARCGRYVLDDKGGIFSKRELVPCPRCVPLRTNGIVPLERDPYDDDRKFWKKRTATFEPGFTTLVGCNGIGKTTLLAQVESFLKRRGTPYLRFDNLGDEGGQKSAGNMLGAALSGLRDEDASIELAASLWSASEGERISASLGRFAKKIGRRIREFDGYGEFWILMDAVDSGLSLDAMEDMKKFLIGGLLSVAPTDMRIYVIASSNSYEMSEDSKIFSVRNMKYAGVSSYAGYRREVLASAEAKRRRDDVFRIKAEIASRPFSFRFDSETAKEAERGNDEPFEGTIAEGEISGIRLSLRTRRSRRSESTSYEATRVVDGERRKFGTTKDYPEVPWTFREKEIEEDVREWLVNAVYRVESKNGRSGKR